MGFTVQPPSVMVFLYWLLLCPEYQKQVICFVVRFFQLVWIPAVLRSFCFLMSGVCMCGICSLWNLFWIAALPLECQYTWRLLASSPKVFIIIPTRIQNATFAISSAATLSFARQKHPISLCYLSKCINFSPFLSHPFQRPLIMPNAGHTLRE